jgi:hypothetical protein
MTVPKLELWKSYTRAEVHAIFSPDTEFTPQAGTWGLHGMVRIPARHGDWVFFVTLGRQQGEHLFDESVTDDGVLSWQSQPAQKLDDSIIRELIDHDDRTNSIHLFLRTRAGRPYAYLGTLGYLTHDRTRSKPVYFQWQLMDWPAPVDTLRKIGLAPIVSPGVSLTQESGTPAQANTIEYVASPNARSRRDGVSTADFRQRKAPDYAVRDARNRALGLAGELLVLNNEKANLTAAGRPDLAAQVVHVAIVEGDGAGYDIRSYDVGGRHRYLEVKTTEGGAETSFFLTSNEISFSATNKNSYELHRLFMFKPSSNSASAYVLDGDLGVTLNLEPTLFRASPFARATAPQSDHAAGALPSPMTSNSKFTSAMPRAGQ